MRGRRAGSKPDGVSLDPPEPPELPDWPLFGLAQDMRPALRRARAAGERAVLATLVATEGGAPRDPGAQMLVTGREVAGFLSGGCVEGDVVRHAAEVLQSGRPASLVYGRDSPHPDIRLLCGARIELLLEPLAPDDPAVARLLALDDARTPAVWATDGARRACLAEAEASDLPGWRVAVEPQPRLIVVGGDPTALALAKLALAAEFETWLVRPKGPEAAPPIAGLRYRRDPAEAALAGIGLDAFTHVAVCTHDLEADEAALVAALPSRAAYVGVLGARRRIPERLARLGAAGVAAPELRRLRAPIGLDLGGKAPFEIAAAILAEITALRREASGPAVWRQG